MQSCNIKWNICYFCGNNAGTSASFYRIFRLLTLLFSFLLFCCPFRTYTTKPHPLRALPSLPAYRNGHNNEYEELHVRNHCMFSQLKLAEYLNINTYQLFLTEHSFFPDARDSSASTSPLTEEDIHPTSPKHGALFAQNVAEYEHEEKEAEDKTVEKTQSFRDMKIPTGEENEEEEEEDYCADISKIPCFSSSLSSELSSALPREKIYLTPFHPMYSLVNIAAPLSSLTPTPTKSYYKSFSSSFSPASSVFPLLLSTYKETSFGRSSASSPSSVENSGRENISSSSSSSDELEGLKGMQSFKLRSTLKDWMRSVFRVKVVRIHPDFSKPWLVSRDIHSSGSAFAIDGRRILTNAHVVTYAHTIFVERPGEPHLYNAKLEVLAHELDLAILTVEDDDFWKDIVPFKLPSSAQPEYYRDLHNNKEKNKQNEKQEVTKEQTDSYSPTKDSPDGFADMREDNHDGEELFKKNVATADGIPNVLDDVLVVGYPVGGTSISVTKGVVNRIEVGTYYHSNNEFLLIQIDAASNRGNSGGPVLNMRGEIVGVVFQGIANAQSVGYVIPVPIINHLLNDVYIHQRYTGIASLGIFTKPFRNPSLKKYLKIFSQNVQEALRENSVATPHGLGCVVTNVNERSIRDYVRYHKKNVSGRNKEAKRTADNIHTNMQVNDNNKVIQEKEDSVDGFMALGPKSQNDDIHEEKKGEVKLNAITNEKEEEVQMEKLEIDGINRGKYNEEEDEKEIGLKVGDILISYDNKLIAEDCTVSFRDHERLPMSYLSTGRYANSTVPITVVRNERVINVLAPLSVNEFVVPMHTWDLKARYIIFGGFVFVALNKSFVLDAPCSNDSKWSVAAAAKQLSRVWKTDQLQEGVVLSVVLSNELTKGYEYENVQLISVNGVKVRDLRHLYDLLKMQESVDYIKQLKDAGSLPLRSTKNGEEEQSEKQNKKTEGEETESKSKQEEEEIKVKKENEDLKTTKKEETKENVLEEKTSRELEDFVTFVFDGIYDIVVMDRIAAIKMLPKILLTHRISSPVSQEL